MDLAMIQFFNSKSKLLFAEMNQSEKGKISHRGIAVKKLIDFLNKQNN